MQASEAKKHVNAYITAGDIAGLRSFLTVIRTEPWFNTDFVLLFALTGLHELELKNGRTSLFGRYRQMERLLEDHYALRRALRRLEWMDDCPAEDIIEMMADKGFSAYEIGWEINACCVDKEKIWRMIRNA